uniref:rRNA biogenesis protein RRP36 n=1 Tax=Phallusia mammillata TaxID=59560 RepID=A0A6F9DS50_9ASCI|nr:ribosomal RNA processing protein 36 homolog [Phallusia mammillata]
MESASESENDASSEILSEDESSNELESDVETDSSDETTEEKPPRRPLISDKVAGTRTKQMSLQELIQMRDRIGTKQFNEQVLKTEKNTKKKFKQADFKRENKNRPQELSSKARVPKIREIIHVPREQRTNRDPRFDNLCGTEYDEELFDKRYSFLENIREREMKSLKQQLVKNKSKASDDQGKLKYLITRMEQQNSAKKDRMAKREALRQWKKEERTKVEQGIKKPFFLKKSDKKKMLMQMQYEQRKEKGTLNKLEARKEKKKKSKESRIMPYQRRTTAT